MKYVNSMIDTVCKYWIMVITDLHKNFLRKRDIANSMLKAKRSDPASTMELIGSAMYELS